MARFVVALAVDSTVLAASVRPALVSGAAAIAVAVVGAVLSYVLGRRTMRSELKNRLEIAQEEGAQTRRTAERQYQLEAMKTLRTAVGAPKSQIIEAAHDLSDRLGGFLGRKHNWEWTNSAGYYRNSFTWLIARPYVWNAILRGQMVYLDQTLGDLIDEEMKFLRHCRLLEDALTQVSLFNGTSYDSTYASAHVFSGRLRKVTDVATVNGRGDHSMPICMGFTEFESLLAEGTKGGTKDSPLADIERLVTGLGDNADPSTPFRLARLIALYTAANRLLEHFSLPFRPFTSVQASLERTEILPDDLRPAIDTNLGAVMAEARCRPGRRQS